MRLFAACLFALTLNAQIAPVTTYRGTLSRLGWYQKETILTPSNVNTNTFGKLGSFAVDGEVYAQPLYVPAVPIPKMGIFNVLYIATENDSIYAFNADLTPGGTPQMFWHASLVNAAQGTAPVTWEDANSSTIYPTIGITSTPVIDLSTKTLYAVAKMTLSPAGQTPFDAFYLVALDIRTGQQKFGSPAQIAAAVAGTCPPLDNLNRTHFNAHTQSQRTALSLANGNVYFGFGSIGDVPPYSGWFLAYNAANVKQQVAAFNSVPNDLGGEYPCLGGIWMSGSAPAFDTSGNMFFATGNGEFDADTMGTDYGDSALKLDPTLHVLDWFTPWDQEGLQEYDGDLGSGGMIILPDQPGPYTHEAVAAGKGPTIYLVNRDDMGGYAGSNTGYDPNIVQALYNGSSSLGVYGLPGYFNGTLYFGGGGDVMKAYQIVNGLLTTSPTQTTQTVFENLGTIPVVSSNGATNGIVWAAEGSYAWNASSQTTLHAYDANNLMMELWNSTQAGSRDTGGLYLQFPLPIVANGRVYLGTRTEVDVYGLLQ